MCQQEVGGGAGYYEKSYWACTYESHGEIIRYDRIYLAYRKEEDYYHEINQKLEQFLTDCGADRERILGIGISWPGIVNLQREEISYSHVLNIESIPFHEISRHFAYPCFFMNDANAGAYAEGIHGDTSGRFFLFFPEQYGGRRYFQRE